MASVLSKLMTAEEFFDFANDPRNRDRHYELESGKVVKVLRPGERHGAVCANGIWLLSNYTWQKQKGYVLANNAGVVLERDPDTVCGPDISLFLESRKFKELEKKWPKRLPKLVVEVMSPTDRMGKMLKRIARFLKKGVAMVWHLEPDEETLTIFMPNKEPIVLERDEEVAELKLLPDFRCKVADFFVMPGE